MFNVAIIGPGKIGETHAQALGHSSKVTLKAFLGRNPEKTAAVAQKYQANSYTDADKMFQQEDLDAVIICTPTYLHKEMVELAIAYKKHVMCEKPFVLDWQDAQYLWEKAENAKVNLMVMQVLRFWPEYNKIKEMILSNQLGNIQNIYLNRLSATPNWATWHTNAQQSGGGLYDLHIHDIDYLYSIFGAVKSVYACGTKSAEGCYNNVSTSLTFQCGVQAIMEGFMSIAGAYPFTTQVRVNGDVGSLELLRSACLNPQGEKSPFTKFEHYTSQGAQGISFTNANPYLTQIDYFADCCDNQLPTHQVPMIQVVEVLKIMQGIKQSLDTQNVVFLK